MEVLSAVTVKRCGPDALLRGLEVRGQEFPIPLSAALKVSTQERDLQFRQVVVSKGIFSSLLHVVKAS